MGIPSQTETKLPSLVDIDAEYRAILSVIHENGEENKAQAEAYLASISEMLVQKIDAYGVIQERMELEIAFWKNQRERCQSAERVFTNTLKSLRERLKFVLTNHPDKSLQGEFFRFFLSKSADTVAIDETILPSEYKVSRMELVVDRDKVKKDLEAGKTIPGAILNRENYSLREGRPKK